jgi:GTP-binding protein
MSLPVVAVVGRPNVGKSTLVHRIVQSRDAIVHESRGVTRDRSYHKADWNGRDFVIIDTGGIESVKSKDTFAPRIREQAVMAAEEADAIIFVVDGSTGITDEDEEVAKILRKQDKPVFLVVNKKDNPATENDNLWDFYSLGVGVPRTAMARVTFSTRSWQSSPQRTSLRMTRSYSRLPSWAGQTLASPLLPTALPERSAPSSPMLQEPPVTPSTP